MAILIICICLLSLGMGKEKVVDYNQEPYTSLLSFFGNGGVQTPDACGDKVKHITAMRDQILGRNTFVHTLHKNSTYADTDRCEATDRQRVETSVTSRSQSWMQGHNGGIFTYAWKVFVPRDFVADGKFCHIHQIKLDGQGVGDPNMTLTIRKSTVDLDNWGDIIGSCPFRDFIGSWVQVREKITYGPKGCVTFSATRMKDGAKLIKVDKCGLKLDSNGRIIRPKFGFYRSLVDSGPLKTESVRIVDICIGEGDSCRYDEFGIKEESNLKVEQQ